MGDCIFCKIVKKEIPAEIVYENGDVMAFLDISPINNGHCVVIPKLHYENIFEIPENILGETIKIVKKVAISLNKIAKGVNVGQNNGKVAGQFINHIHFHVIPRYENDGLKHWSGKTYDEGQIEKLAEELKRIMEED